MKECSLQTILRSSMTEREEVVAFIRRVVKEREEEINDLPTSLVLTEIADDIEDGKYKENDID